MEFLTENNVDIKRENQELKYGIGKIRGSLVLMKYFKKGINNLGKHT